MRIDAVGLYHVAMPLLRPWRTAYGEDASVESVLVRLWAEGECAWGESTPLAAPCFSAEWAGGVFTLLRDWLAPAIVGCEIDSGQALRRHLAHFKGNPFAKAALDVAWWALHAQRRGEPLHQCLGAVRRPIVVGADFGVTDTIDELLAEIGEAVAAGFPRIKLKFRPGWDLAMLEAVRRAFPDTTLHVDCNAGYRLDDIELLRRLDAFDLAMIEQPLAADALHEHARLQRELNTPVCLDESIDSPDRMRQAIEQGSCRCVNIKPGRVGGLTAALDIHALCRAANIDMWVGGMLESSVGAHACMALAGLDGLTYPPDLFPSDRFYAEDLAEPAVTLTSDDRGRPCVIPPDLPGLGSAPNQRRLERCCVQRTEIRSDRSHRTATPREARQEQSP